MSEQADPTQARYLTSYMARRQYADDIQYPPSVPGVKGFIDIHAHAHEGQQDALALARRKLFDFLRRHLNRS